MLTAGSRLDKSSDALRSTSPTALFAAHRSFERGRAREDVRRGSPRGSQFPSRFAPLARMCAHFVGVLLTDSPLNEEKRRPLHPRAPALASGFSAPLLDPTAAH